MKRLITILTTVAPFLVGLVLGCLLFYTIQTWGIGLQSLVKWLGVTAAVVLILSVVIWISYRVLAAKLSQESYPALWRLIREVSAEPKKFSDPAYREQNVWPLLPSLLKALVAWLGFSNAMALAITLVANVTLMATLAVQYLQADRLSAQNALLEIQTLADQIQQGRSLREDLSTLGTVEREVRRILEAYATTGSVAVKSQHVKEAMQVESFKLSPCSIYGTNSVDSVDSADCKRTSFQEIYQALSESEGGKYPAHKFHDSIELLGSYLVIRDRAFDSATREIRGVSESLDNGGASATGSARDFVETSSSVCRFDPDQSRELALKLASLRLIETNSSFVAGIKFQPSFLEMKSRFPQVGDNTERGFLDFDSGVLGLMGNAEGSDDRAFTMQEVAFKLTKEIIALNDLLLSLATSCKDEAERIRQSLRALEANLGGQK